MSRDSHIKFECNPTNRLLYIISFTSFLDILQNVLLWLSAKNIWEEFSRHMVIFVKMYLIPTTPPPILAKSLSTNQKEQPYQI